MQLVSWNGRVADESANAALWHYPIETPQQVLLRASSTSSANKSNNISSLTNIEGTFLSVRRSGLPDAGLGLFARQHLAENRFLDPYGACYLAQPLENAKKSTNKNKNRPLEDKYMVSVCEKQTLYLEAYDPNDEHEAFFVMVIENRQIHWKRWRPCQCVQSQSVQPVQLDSQPPQAQECRVFVYPENMRILDSFAMYANDNYRSYHVLQSEEEEEKEKEEEKACESESTGNAALIVVEFTPQLLEQRCGITSLTSIFRVYLITLLPIRENEEILISYGQRVYWSHEHIFRANEAYPSRVYHEFVRRIVAKLGMPNRKQQEQVILFIDENESKKQGQPVFAIAEWQTNISEAKLIQQGGILTHVGENYNNEYHNLLQEGLSPRVWLIVKNKPLTNLNSMLQLVPPLFPYLQDTPLTNSFIEIDDNGDLRDYKRPWLIPEISPEISPEILPEISKAETKTELVDISKLFTDLQIPLSPRSAPQTGPQNDPPDPAPLEPAPPIVVLSTLPPKPTPTPSTRRASSASFKTKRATKTTLTLTIEGKKVPEITIQVGKKKVSDKSRMPRSKKRKRGMKSNNANEALIQAYQSFLRQSELKTSTRQKHLQFFTLMVKHGIQLSEMIQSQNNLGTIAQRILKTSNLNTIRGHKGAYRHLVNFHKVWSNS